MIGRMWGVILGGGLLVGCGRSSTDVRLIEAAYVGGDPFANQWLVPVKTSTPSQGWWSGESYEVLGDTLYTDESGTCRLPESLDCVDAFLCQPHGDWEDPFLINRFERAFSSEAEVWLLELPQVIWFKVVGNRPGQMLDSRIWVTSNWEGLNFDSDQWFTPGQPPRPSYLLQHWVMPKSSTPFYAELRYQDENGHEAAVASIEFGPADLLDTLIVPLNF